MAQSPSYLKQLTTDHIKAGSAALTEIARRASKSAEKSDLTPVRLRVGHLDHGAFLSLQLNLFPIYQVEEDRLVDIRQRGSEVLVAIVVNQPVELQIRSLLKFMNSLVARQSLIGRKVLQGDIGSIDAEVESADAAAESDIEDGLRGGGDWRLAADAIAERALSAGLQLDARFVAPLLSLEELALRAPILRCVYNTEPSVRNAVDKAASLLALPLKLEGPDVPDEMMAYAQQVLEAGQLKRYLAHLARDAFVSGNGYLTFGSTTSNLPEPKLLKPEKVRVTGPEQYEVLDDFGSATAVTGRVIHMRGAHQVNSPYGISVLEPFVVIVGQRDVMVAVQQDIQRFEREASFTQLPQIRKWADEVGPLAARSIREAPDRIKSVLGDAVDAYREPDPEELYFPGFERMRDALESIRFRDPTGN
jgi:hypothetical protein